MRGDSRWKRLPRLAVATLVVVAVLAILGLAAVGTATLWFGESPSALWTRIGSLALDVGKRGLVVGMIAVTAAFVALMLAAGRSIGRKDADHGPPPPAGGPLYLPAPRVVSEPARRGQGSSPASEHTEFEEVLTRGTAG